MVQGKENLLLGNHSIIWTLFGFEVHMACYNPSLARRDQQNFKELFEKLKTDINHGDLNKWIEKLLKRDFGSIRDDL